MKTFYMLAPLLLVASIIDAGPLASHSSRSNEIQWDDKCTFNTTTATLPVQCANFTVPLDYANESSGATHTFEVIKVPARKEPKQGSIFFNFGGPGIAVRPILAELGRRLQAITGGHFDLIGIDPRGTADNLPFNCYPNETVKAAALALLPNAGAANASNVELGRIWAVQSVLAENCAAYGDAQAKGDIIGTAYTARDMMAVVDKIEEDGLLRYWGFSYGTTLGATVAAMFPSRMERVILDGVMNFEEYYTAVESEVYSDSDATFAGFLEECVRAPEQCLLAANRPNSTASSLEVDFYNTLERIKHNPVPFQGSVIDYSVIKLVIRPSMYSPAHWPALSVALDGLLSGNMTQFIIGALDILGGSSEVFVGGGNDSPIGIHCSDKVLEDAETLDELRPRLNEAMSISRLIGDATVSLATACAKWPWKAKERYTGGFANIRTKHPLLFLGNTHDSATSIKAAFTMSEGFVGSVVVRQDGFGHSTTAEVSTCIARIVKTYFEEGSLPEPATSCDVDFDHWTEKTWDDVIPKLEEENGYSI